MWWISDGELYIATRQLKLNVYFHSSIWINGTVAVYWYYWFKKYLSRINIAKATNNNELVKQAMQYWLQGQQTCQICVHIPWHQREHFSHTALFQYSWDALSIRHGHGFQTSAVCVHQTNNVLCLHSTATAACPTQNAKQWTNTSHILPFT